MGRRGSLSCTLSHGKPDKQAKYRYRSGECTAEQPERAVQDRLAVHFDSDVDGRSIEPIGEALFPRENVSTGSTTGLPRLQVARVVPQDPAREVQAECDDFGTVPADVLERAGAKRGSAHLLFEDVMPVLRPQLVMRPGERARLAQFPDVLDVKADLDEAATRAAPGRADAGDRSDRRTV